MAVAIQPYTLSLTVCDPDNYIPHLVLDVRRADEVTAFQSIPAPHSCNIPVETLSDALTKSNEAFKEAYGVDKPSSSTWIIVVSRTGEERSKKACEVLMSAGHRPVYYLQGGVCRWQEQVGGEVKGYPAFAPGAPIPTAHTVAQVTPPPELKNKLTSAELHTKFADGSAPTVIDTRRPDELENFGKIAASHNVPIEELPVAVVLSPSEFQAKYGFNKYETDKPVAFHCRTSRRAKFATYLHCDLGYTAPTLITDGVVGYSKVDPSVKAYPSYEVGQPIPAPM